MLENNIFLISVSVIIIAVGTYFNYKFNHIETK